MSDISYQTMPIERAIRFVRRSRRRTLFIGCDVKVHVRDEPSHYWPTSVNVPVSARVLLKVLTDVAEQRTGGRAAVVTLGFSEHCLFAFCGTRSDAPEVE